MNYLKNPSTLFIATNIDQNIKFPDFIFPDAGPLVAAIENGSGRKATIIGKPSKFLYDMISKDFALVSRSKIIMIGDRLDVDVLFGKRNDLKTIFVESGVHKISDVEEIQLKIASSNRTKLFQYIPDYFVPKLSDLLNKFE